MENRFKRSIAQGELQLGLWNSLCSSITAEMLSGVGYDWMLFDTEHAPVEVSGVLPLLQAAATGVSHSVVRPAWNDPVLIKRLLDIGARTLLVPFVQTAADARNAVAACRYPPQGMRGVAGLTRASGFGRHKEYLLQANNEICLLVQVETLEAVANLDAIAATEGVDGVFIGPSDLAASMGHIGRPGNDEVQQVIGEALSRIRASGKPAGILATSEAAARGYIDMGFTFVAIGIDAALLLSACERLLTSMKNEN